MAGRIGAEELHAVQRVLEGGELSPFFASFKGGTMVRQFERDFSNYLGIKHAVSTSSGTAALHTALLALGVEKGDKVVTSPYSFIASASAIMMCEAEPVFCDVDPYTYNIDVDKLAQVLHAETHKDGVKGIMPVHLLGHSCDMKPIRELAAEYGIFVLEDSAQALGAEYRHRKTGTLSDIAIFSFQQSKTITTGGEGGIIVTNNDELHERCCWIRNHGEKYSPQSYFWHGKPIIGYNYRLTELQAAIGVEQLKKLDGLNDMQIKNAQYLCEHFPNAILPPFVADYATKHSFYIIGANWKKGSKMTREEFIQELKNLGISKGVPGQNVSVGYGKLMYEHYVVNRYKTSCPVAESLLNTSLWFDIHRFNKNETVMKEYCDVFNQILK